MSIRGMRAAIRRSPTSRRTPSEARSTIALSRPMHRGSPPSAMCQPTSRLASERLLSRPRGKRDARRGPGLPHAEVGGLATAEPTEVVLDRPQHRAFEVEDAGDLAGEAYRLPVEQRVGARRLQLRIAGADQRVQRARVPDD